MKTIVSGGCFALFMAIVPGCHQEPCSSQDVCQRHGRCAGEGSDCRAANDYDCSASEDCKVRGMCTADGSCVARSERDCMASTDCAFRGACGLKEGDCVPVEYMDCKKSQLCKERGKCTLVGNDCVARSDERDNKEGCPCGCDHSTEMAAELRAAPDASALSAIDETLRTIAEREDAGYITEAMIEHRMRMLDLLGELERPVDHGNRRDRGVPLITQAPMRGPLIDGSSLRGRAELSAHGQTTEVVRGKEKLLRASFRIGLSLQNKTGAPLTVAMPAIQGNVGMPISRWYELGSDGRAWDGMLAPGETKAINVIGYLSEPVEPGSALDATVTIDAMTLTTHTVASAHWASLHPSR